MSYVKNTWAIGDTLSMARLNHIESGVEDINMSYTKHTWTSGETITAEKLNHIETGIENGGGDSTGGYRNITSIEIPINSIAELSGAGELLYLTISVSIHYGEDNDICISDYFYQTETNSLVLPFIEGYNTELYINGVYENWDTCFPDSNEISATGNITIDENNCFIITGEGTISLAFRNSTL